MMDSTTTTDRELLEMAAKAAGMDYLIWTPGASPIVPSGPRFGDRMTWNPLADDGDALRLAVKLRIDIGYYDSQGHVRAHPRNTRGHILFVAEDYHAHPTIEAATRRAIVRAAAEIGRSQHG